MKKALILSYHFLPSNVIAGRRAKAYMDFFSQNNIEPTLITHSYEENIISSNSDIIEETYNNHQVFRIPQKKSSLGNFKRFLWRFSITRVIQIIFSKMLGYLDADDCNEDSYIQFKHFLWHHLNTNSYDICIVTFNPHFLLKLAFETKQKFNLPYILDFRDLWGIHLIKEKAAITLKQLFIDKFTKFYWKKWIESSYAYSITSQEWLDILESFVDKKGHVITNGYEDDFDQIKANKTEKFSIGYMGAIYPDQDVHLFISGFKMFLKEPIVDDTETFLYLKGINEFNYPNILSLFKSELPKNIKILERGNMHEVIHFCKSMWVMWFPAFKDVKGWFSAKLYDFIASESNILFEPEGKGLIKETIQVLPHVNFANTPEQVKESLMSLYKQWKEEPHSLQKSIPKDTLKPFKRSYQAERMAEIINNNL